MCFKCLMVIWVWGHLMVNTLSQSDPNERAHHRAIAAPRGKVPPCVSQRGQTFCENVAGYPYDLILNALGRSKFDITKLLVDESTDDAPNFLSIITPSTSQSGDRKISEDKLLDDDVIPLHVLSRPLGVSHERSTRHFITDNSTLTMNLKVFSSSHPQISQIKRYRRLDQFSATLRAFLCNFNSGYGYFHQYFGCQQRPPTIRN
ncbi:uncharacterized protein [Euwallacea similis]|uniref:uncharacterized protein n=1 Tax=Euwallacea similis TaxID=1736056 RepID=UPI00344CAD4E